MVATGERTVTHQHANVLAVVIAAHFGALVAPARLFRLTTLLTLFRAQFVLLRFVALERFRLTAALTAHFNHFFTLCALARVAFRLANVQIVISAAR